MCSRFRFAINNLLEYSLNYSDMKDTLQFYSKDEEVDFNGNIVTNKNFKLFKCRTGLMGNTVADGANGILKNSNIAVPLKCLSNFWQLSEMLLINCKVELKLKWMNHCEYYF